ncbi:Endochitinase 1 [Bulinus truncatus]|nr:Endochitinase 1 [Bulinus truncatus]
MNGTMMTWTGQLALYTCFNKPQTAKHEPENSSGRGWLERFPGALTYVQQACVPPHPPGKFSSNYAITFLSRQELPDGLDLDWEYPVLTKNLANGETSAHIAALAAGKSTIDAAYEVDKIAQRHGGWDEYVGHNSPLYSFKNYEEDVLYVKYTVDYYLSLGVPKSKLVVGIPSYGRSMMLKDKNNNGPDAPVKGGGPQGPYTEGGGLA